MPARVRCRSVQDSVDDEERSAGPAWPQQAAADPEGDQQAHPDGGIAQRRAIATTHELLHPLAGHIGVVPLGRYQSLLSRALRAGADETVIAIAVSAHQGLSRRTGS